MVANAALLEGVINLRLLRGQEGDCAAQELVGLQGHSVQSTSSCDHELEHLKLHTLAKECGSYS